MRIIGAPLLRIAAFVFGGVVCFLVVGELSHDDDVLTTGGKSSQKASQANSNPASPSIAAAKSSEGWKIWLNRASTSVWAANRESFISAASLEAAEHNVTESDVLAFAADLHLPIEELRLHLSLHHWLLKLPTPAPINITDDSLLIAGELVHPVRLASLFDSIQRYDTSPRLAAIVIAMCAHRDAVPISEIVTACDDSTLENVCNGILTFYGRPKLVADLATEMARSKRTIPVSIAAAHQQVEAGERSLQEMTDSEIDAASTVVPMNIDVANELIERAVSNKHVPDKLFDDGIRVLAREGNIEQLVSNLARVPPSIRSRGLENAISELAKEQDRLPVSLMEALPQEERDSVLVKASAARLRERGLEAWASWLNQFPPSTAIAMVVEAQPETAASIAYDGTHLADIKSIIVKSIQGIPESNTIHELLSKFDFGVEVIK